MQEERVEVFWLRPSLDEAEVYFKLTSRLSICAAVEHQSRLRVIPPERERGRGREDLFFGKRNIPLRSV